MTLKASSNLSWICVILTLIYGPTIKLNCSIVLVLVTYVLPFVLCSQTLFVSACLYISRLQINCHDVLSNINIGLMLYLCWFSGVLLLVIFYITFKYFPF